MVRRATFGRRFGSCMFRCQMCGEVVPPRTRATRVVVRRRPKPYPYRLHANTIYRPDRRGRMKPYPVDDPGGAGWEIAREVLACPKCAAEGVPRGVAAGGQGRPGA